MAEPLIEDTLRALDEEDRGARAQTARLRTVGRAISAVTLVTFLAFAWATWAKVASQWDSKRFETAAQYEAQKLDEPFLDHLRVAGNQISPLYMKMFRETLDEMLPKLGEKALKEVGPMTDRIMKSAGAQVEQAVERIELSHRKELRRLYPKAQLPAEDPVGLLGTEDERREDLLVVMASFKAQFHDEVGSLQESLNSFPTRHLSHLSRETLMRLFAHLWLTLLDRQLLQKDAPEGGTHGG